MKKFLLLVLAFSLFVSCEKDDVVSSSVSAKCITGAATEIDQSSARLNGSVSISNATSSSGTACFYYAITKGDAKTLKQAGRVSAGTISSSGGSFTATLNSLDAGATYYYVAAVTIDGTEFFGDVKSFDTSKKNELTVTCSTEDATEVGPSSAKLNGAATIMYAASSGGSACFFYSEKQGDAQSLKKANKVDAGTIPSQGGSFFSTVSDIEPSTIYYYVASITIDGKEFFGEVKSFTTAEKPKDPTVTGEATEVTEISAKLSGYANPTSDMGTITMGILYSTNADLTYDNAKRLISKELDGNNMYTVVVRDLKPSTTYYFKSFIQYNGIVRTGETKAFTTKDIDASVTTNDATNVSETKATLNGRLTVNTQENLSKSAWFLYSDTQNTLDGLRTGGRRVSVTLQDDGSFSNNLGSLSSGVTYYFIAVANVGEKEFYGEIKSFTTGKVNTSISTNEATNITTTKATLNGKLTVNSQESFSKSVWFLYSDTQISLDGLKSSGIKASSTLKDDGSFSYPLNYLVPGQTYHFVAVAKVGDQEIYGAVKSFTTEEITVSTNAASSITTTKATLNGKLTVNSQESFSKSAWFLYSEFDETVEGLKNNGRMVLATLQDDGTFKCELSDLAPGQTYSYVAAARVGGNEFYGAVKEFTTESAQLSVSTYSATNVTETHATLNGKLNKNFDFSEIEIFVNSNSMGFIFSNTEKTLDGLKSKGRYLNGMPLSIHDDYSFSYELYDLLPGETYYFVAYASINANTYNGIEGLYYGSVNSFTTPSVNVSVSTSGATSIAETKATLNGNMTVSSQGELSGYAWFLYSDTETTLDGLKSNGNFSNEITIQSGGPFQIDIDDLEPGKKYFYVAVGSVFNNEYYGAVKSFTTNDLSVSTNAASNVSETKATINGKLNNYSGDSSDKVVWFLYGDKQTSLSDLINSGKKEEVNLLNDGSFSYSLSNLPLEKTYYYVAACRIGYQDYYGSVRSFTTRGIEASVTTNDATNVSETKATINGRLVDNTFEDFPQQVWFIYSETENTLEGMKRNGSVIHTLLNDDGTFSHSMGNLQLETKYYYVACGSVNDQVFYGEIKSFSTCIDMVVTTNDATNVSETKATISGKLDDMTKEGFAKIVYFLYSNTENPINWNIANSTLQQDGSFMADLSSLSPGNTYYYQAVAELDLTGYGVYANYEPTCGSIKSFTTREINGSVQTLDVTNLTEKRATLNGILESNTVEDFTKSGGFRYSDTETTLEGLKSNGNSSSSLMVQADGTFSYELSSLSSGKTYYYVAFANLDNKRIYGEVKSFTPKELTVSVLTKDASDITELGATISGEMKVDALENYSKSVGFLYSETETTLEGLISKGRGSALTTQNYDDFKIGLYSLKPGKTYHYVAYGSVDGQRYYGEVKSFTTGEINVSVSTIGATSLSYDQVELKGKLTVNETKEDLQKSVGFYYCEGNAYKSYSDILTYGKMEYATLQDDGSFSCTIDSHAQTIYFFARGIVLIRDSNNSIKYQSDECYGDILSISR